MPLNKLLGSVNLSGCVEMTQRCTPRFVTSSVLRVREMVSASGLLSQGSQDDRQKVGYRLVSQCLHTVAMPGALAPSSRLAGVPERVGG